MYMGFIGPSYISPTMYMGFKGPSYEIPFKPNHHFKESRYKCSMIDKYILLKKLSLQT